MQLIGIQMATIKITQDRGLVIFSPPQTGPDGEARQPRLMGLVCMVSSNPLSNGLGMAESLTD